MKSLPIKSLPSLYWQALHDSFWLENTASETRLIKPYTSFKDKPLLCFRIILPVSLEVLLLSSFDLERKSISSTKTGPEVHRCTSCITSHTLKRNSRNVRSRNSNFQFNLRDSTYCEASIPKSGAQHWRWRPAEDLIRMSSKISFSIGSEQPSYSLIISAHWHVCRSAITWKWASRVQHRLACLSGMSKN